MCVGRGWQLHSPLHDVARKETSSIWRSGKMLWSWKSCTQTFQTWDHSIGGAKGVCPFWSWSRVLVPGIYRQIQQGHAGRPLLQPGKGCDVPCVSLGKGVFWWYYSTGCSGVEKWQLSLAWEHGLLCFWNQSLQDPELWQKSSCSSLLFKYKCPGPTLCRIPSPGAQVSQMCRTPS